MLHDEVGARRPSISVAAPRSTRPETSAAATRTYRCRAVLNQGRPVNRHPLIAATSVAAALVACVAAAPSALAGPWSRDAGGVYAKLSSGVFLASAYVDPAGNTVDDVEYLGLTQSLYAEFGVGPKLQVQVYLPHVTAENRYAGTGDRYLAFGGGDAKLGVQWSPPLPFPAALRLDAKVPTYDVAEPGGSEGALFPALGDGQLDVDLWLSAGGSVDGLPLYGFVEIGHRFRTEQFIGDGADVEYGDSFVTYGQVGYTVGPSIIVALNAQAVVPYDDDGVTKGYATIGPSIYAPVGGGFALEAYYDANIWARSSSRGQTVIAGVSFNRAPGGD